jgi:hypothetical protein
LSFAEYADNPHWLSLEQILQSKLHDSAGRGALDPAELRAVVVAAGILEIRVIQDIRPLGAKLHSMCFLQFEYPG